MRQHGTGFTLTGLLIVIVVIGVLMDLLFPVLNGIAAERGSRFLHQQPAAN